MDKRWIVNIFGVLLLFGFLGFFVFSSFLEVNHLTVRDSFASILTGLSQYSISEDTIPPTIVISSPIDGETIIGGDGTNFGATFTLDGTGTEPNYAVISIDSSPVVVLDYAFISSSCAMVGGDPTIRTCNVVVTADRGVHTLAVETADGGEFPGGNTAVSAITVKVNNINIVCGTNILESAILIEDLDCSGYLGEALTIFAGGSLDCDGYTVTGNAGSGFNGVHVSNAENLYVQNCNIQNSAAGIFLEQTGTNTLVTDNTLMGNLIGINILNEGAAPIIYHNNIYDNINYGITGGNPLEVSNLESGNYWGISSGCPSFISGLTSNRVDIIDSYSYYEQDGWITGVPDCEECPEDPDKTHPGICGCGVADTDTDGDGTADCIDECDLDPLKTAPGICGCGIADTDSDSDGTPDCNDLCPADPLKTALGICGCGIADTDTDGDGTADCMEECDGDPLKLDPGACGCGFPDDLYGMSCESDSNICGETNWGTTDCSGVCDAVTPDALDSDGDGTPDCIDGCSEDPLKTEPGACGCGVADTDSDGDGTPDCIDICSGFDDSTDSDSDGAPDGCDSCPLDSDNDVDSDGICGNVDECPSDPDNDADSDGICGDVDNCPTVSNPGQTDSDGDGLGEECDCDNVITGDLTFTTDKTCDGDGFVFGADNAILDCNGHSISVSSGDYGIYTDGYSGVGVKNCEIIGGSIGVHVYSSDGVTLENNVIRGSYNQGIFVEGIAPITSDHVITGNTLMENCNSGSNNCGAIQLYQEDNCRIENNDISDSYSHGVLLVDSNHNDISSNTISSCNRAGIIATSPIDATLGGYNTLEGNTITDCAPGIAVKTEENGITNNEIVSYEGGNYGIDLRRAGPAASPENTYLFGNDVSGFTYGLNVWSGITSFTANNENYHDNYYGVYLNGAGTDDTRPLIENSAISNNADCAISLVSNSRLELNNPTLTEILSKGLCVDWSSKAYVADGVFEGADSGGGHSAIYDVSPLYVSWTLNSAEASCKDSSVLYSGDLVFNRGAELELQNCELNINGEVVSSYDGIMYSFDKADVSVTADVESSTTFGNADATLSVTTSDDTTATLTVAAFSPGLPLGDLINLKGVIVRMDDYSTSISTSRNLKISYEDFELEEKNIDEGTLKIYHYDSGSGEWVMESDQEIDMSGNYISADFAELGLFGVFGSELTGDGGEDGSGGDENGGTTGGGATGGAAYGTYSVNNAQLLAGYTKSLTTGGGFRFYGTGASHSIKVMSFFPNGIILLIASTPQNVSFLVGEEKKFDFDEDSIYDLSVKLNSVDEMKKLANITILAISEKVVATEEEVPSSEIGERIGEELSARIYELKKLVSLLIILVLLVAIVLIAWAIASTICREKRSVSTGSDFTAAEARLFVKRARIRGYSKAEIRRMFLKKGWSKREIRSIAGL